MHLTGLLVFLIALAGVVCSSVYIIIFRVPAQEFDRALSGICELCVLQFVADRESIQIVHAHCGASKLASFCVCSY